MDFTLPNWFHEARGTGAQGRARQLVPLALIRKEPLVNFCLRDDEDAAIPLLSTSQNFKVSEATVSVLARAVLGRKVPKAIGCDLRRLILAKPSEADDTLERLYGTRDKSAPMRAVLRDNDAFQAIVNPLGTQFLALTMMEIGRQERRVVHFSYDEPVSAGFDDGLFDVQLGVETLSFFTIPDAGNAESSHFELEAPDGMKIADANLVTFDQNGPVDRPTRQRGGLSRVHIHLDSVEGGTQALVIARLEPRPETIIRASCIAAAACALLLAFFAWRLPILDPRYGEKAAETAAAILLAVQSIVAVQLARSDENPMTTAQLFRVRVVAALPALGSFIGAAILVGGFDGKIERAGFIAGAVLATVSMSVLGVWWRQIARDET